MPLDKGPVTEEAFAICMDQLGLRRSQGNLFVACSGGVDSLCLTLLLKQWLGREASGLKALIVDHKLRSTSTFEAKQVSELLHTHGIKAEILTWEHAPLTSGIEALGRSARYNLMSEYILKNRCKNACLFTGHHQDDQVETFLMRLETGSGIRGLAGMSSAGMSSAGMSSASMSSAGMSSKVHGRHSPYELCRPLLNFSKKQLVETLKNFGVAPIEDSSNEDQSFRRNWLRANRSQIEQAGLNAQKIQKLQSTYARLRAWTEKSAVSFIEDRVELNSLGWAKLKLDALEALPKEIQCEVLLRLINWLKPEAKGPVLSVKNLDAMVGQGSLNAGVRSKRSAGSLYMFPAIDDTAFGPVVSDINQCSKAAGFHVGQLGPKRAQKFAREIVPKSAGAVPSYVLASMLVIQQEKSGLSFCMPQFGFCNLCIEGCQRSAISRNFGHMRQAGPSKHIFAVVSDQDLLT